MKPAFLVYCVLIHGVVSQTQLHRQEMMTAPAGLYLEGMDPVKRITGEWTIFTCIELQNIYVHSEPLTPLLIRVANQTNFKASLNFLETLPIWEDEDEINSQRWKVFRDQVHPFTINMTKDHNSYSSNAPKEIDDINDHLMRAERVNLVSDPDKQISYINFGLENLITEVELMKIQLKYKLQILIDEETDLETKEDASNEAYAILTSIIRTRAMIFSVITDIIMNAKLGLIHPFTFQQAQLRILLAKLSNENSESYTPLPKDGLALLQLKDITNMQLILKNGRIFIIMKVPLVKNLSDKIYRIHSHPVFQNISRDMRIFSSVLPSADYLWMANGGQKYSLVSRNFMINFCKKVNDQLICKAPPTFTDATKDSPCEVILYHDVSNETIPSCEIELIKGPENMWIPLERPGSWLYSFSTLTTAELTCPFFPTISVLVEGNGRIDLEEGCVLNLRDAIYTGASEQNHIPDVVPRRRLDLVTIFPEIEKYQPLLRFSPKISLNNLLVLEVMSRNLKQINYVTSKHTYFKDVTIPWKIIIVLNLVLIAFLYTFKRLIKCIPKERRHAGTIETSKLQNFPSKPMTADEANQWEEPIPYCGRSLGSACPEYSVSFDFPSSEPLMTKTIRDTTPTDNHYFLPRSDIPEDFTFTSIEQSMTEDSRSINRSDSHYSFPRAPRPYLPAPSTSRMRPEDPLFDGEEESIYVTMH